MLMGQTIMVINNQDSIESNKVVMIEFNRASTTRSCLIIPNFRNSYAVGWLESPCQQEKQSFVIILPTPWADVGLNFIEMKSIVPYRM